MPTLLSWLDRSIRVILGGVGLLLLLGATVLAPLAWRVPVLAVLGGAGLVGCLLRSRTRRWSILSAALHGAGGHRGPTHSRKSAKIIF